MSGRGDLRQERPNPLPHQAAFIEQFFANPSTRGHLLQSDVGLGTSFMAAHLIRRLLETQPAARVLVLLPKTLQIQMREVLTSIGVSAEAIDRFRYRELQDAAPAEDTVWRAGAVSILSVDFAKQEDIARSLAAVPWTLLVVPEAHLLRGLREQVVRQIVASSPDLRMVLITVTGVDDISAFGIEPFTTTRWHRSQVVDHAGQHLFTQPPTQLEVIEFQEEAAERRMHEAVEEIAHLLEATDGAALLSALFLRSLTSSPAALEEGMRRFRNRLTHGMLELVPADGEGDDETDTDDLPSVMPENREKLLVALDRCLKELESLTVDSKLNAFVNKLAAMRADHSAPTAMCILTEYRATLFYLQTQLEETALNSYVLHGSIPFDERAHNVQGFKQHGGILLATTAMVTTGFDLPQVESLILYDLPRSPLMLQQVYGRFQRFGRTEPLRLSVLCDPNRANSAATMIVDKLREIVADEGTLGLGGIS